MRLRCAMVTSVRLSVRPTPGHKSRTEVVRNFRFDESIFAHVISLVCLSICQSLFVYLYGMDVMSEINKMYVCMYVYSPSRV